jgi:hypothetical protein
MINVWQRIKDSLSWTAWVNEMWNKIHWHMPVVSIRKPFCMYVRRKLIIVRISQYILTIIAHFLKRFTCCESAWSFLSPCIFMFYFVFVHHQDQLNVWNTNYKYFFSGIYIHIREDNKLKNTYAQMLFKEYILNNELTLYEKFSFWK